MGTATTSVKPTLTDIEAAFAAERNKTAICPVAKVISEHEHGPAIEVKVMDVLNYSAPTINRVLKTFGIGLSVEAIQKHRKGTCKCQPSD